MNDLIVDKDGSVREICECPKCGEWIKLIKGNLGKRPDLQYECPYCNGEIYFQPPVEFKDDTEDLSVLLVILFFFGYGWLWSI